MSLATKIVTIGVYGFTEEGFFEALQNAGVDLLCDVRARRGLRGAKYAFANSKRLQAGLLDRGIDYVHVRDLAPTQAARDAQHAHDKADGVGKRVREVLCQDFVTCYEDETLQGFDLEQFLNETIGHHEVPALLCVERPPGACHRSIVAHRIRERFGLRIQDLAP